MLNKIALSIEHECDFGKRSGFGDAREVESMAPVEKQATFG